jgi:hypothetical protein
MSSTARFEVSSFFNLKTLIMPSSPANSWKAYFSTNIDLDSSNLLLDKIKNAVSALVPFIIFLEEISKNQGITFISLDP